MAEPVIHPLGISVLRSFLLSWDLVTDRTGQRVGTSMPGENTSPRFPALRLTDINSVVVIPRRWVRMFPQVDCWAATQAESDELARVVVAVLQETANYIPPDGRAVLGEAVDIVARTDPDDSLTPVQPRAIVSCHIPIRPNP